MRWYTYIIKVKINPASRCREVNDSGQDRVSGIDEMGYTGEGLAFAYQSVRGLAVVPLARHGRTH